MTVRLSKSTLISKSVLIYDCFKFLCRQVFGLTGVLILFWPALPSHKNWPMFMVAFVPDYRCWTAPGFHRIPFCSTTAGAVANRLKLPYTVYSYSVNTKYCVFCQDKANRISGPEAMFLLWILAALTYIPVIERKWSNIPPGYMIGVHVVDSWAIWLVLCVP